MTPQDAKNTLAEVITPPRWGAFVAWLEEAEEGGDGVCAHDPVDYEDWLRAQGDNLKLFTKAQLIWDAMIALGKAPCRCNAGAELWRGDELDDVVFPLMHARVTDLPRALTGLPEVLSTDQQELYGKFYGAGRGVNSLFARLPEPPFDGDVAAGMAMATGLAWLARLSPACEPVVQSSFANLNNFFHTGAFEDVAAHYREAQRPLLSFDKVLEDLAVYAVQQADGTPSHALVVHTPDGPRKGGMKGLQHLIVARPAEGTVFVDDSVWLPFPADGLSVSGTGGSATLARQDAGLHVVRLG